LHFLCPGKIFKHYPNAQKIYPFPEIPLQFNCLSDGDLTFDLKYQNNTSTDSLPKIDVRRNKTTGNLRIIVDQEDVKANLLVTCKDDRNANTWTVFINGKSRM
jgi:hypothetical protein